MKKAPPMRGFSIHRPKNSHRRMITGIGTPNSHNNSPRPIVSSSIVD